MSSINSATVLVKSHRFLKVFLPASLAFADIFAWQIDFFTDTRQGDSFKIIYEIETAEKNKCTFKSYSCQI